jgi:hypothetical protein
MKIYTNGYAEPATTAYQYLGICHSILDKYGISICPALSKMATTGSATSVTTGGLTTASDNATSGKDNIQVALDVSLDSIYTAAVTGTLGATVTVAQGGFWIDIATGGVSLTETTASRAAVKMCYCWGLDPLDSTRLLVSKTKDERLGGYIS